MAPCADPCTHANVFMKEDSSKSLQDSIPDQLKILIEEKQVYRQPRLRLGELARMVGTNRYYLSRHINLVYGQNFNEYINRYRVEYAKKFMLQNPNSLIDQVSATSGFGSIETFSRTFKSIVGVSPDRWRNQCRQDIR